MTSAVWLDVEDTDGNLLGEGPITTVVEWESSVRLSRAGAFRARIPAADPRVALIAAKRIVRCKTMIDGAEVEVGAGIIDNIQLSTAPPYMLEIDGPDLAGELSYRTVAELTLLGETETTPTNVWRYDKDTDSTITMTNAFDDNEATGHTFTFDNTQDYVYVQLPTFPGALYFLFGSFTNNLVRTVIYEYWNGSNWNALDFTDGTVIDGKPWKQSGQVSWPDPGDAVTGGWAGVTEYIIRMRISSALQQVEILEIDQIEYGPETADIEQIMALAPDGWSLDTDDWYSGTADGSYLQMEKETVLAALVRFAELHGEHWRINGRTVQWMRSDTPSSGLRIVSDAPDPADAVAAGLILCGANGIQRQQDSYEQVTRLYALGGGAGAARVTLADATDSAPTGYTLSTANGYIEVTGASPEIHRAEVFSDIRPLNNNEDAYAEAGNRLLVAGHAWLAARQGYVAYTIDDLFNVPVSLLVGETINVTAFKRVGSYTVYDIDADLIVLEIVRAISAQKLHTRLIVSNLARQPVSDAEALVATAENLELFRQYPQNIPDTQVIAT